MNTRASSTEVRELLTRAGATPPPEPDTAYVAALEQRLRAVHELQTRGTLASAPATTDVPARTASRPRRRLLAVVAAAAAVVVAASVLLVGGTQRSASALRLARAVGTTVQLPDGRVVEGRRGLSLPDGAIVRTGPDGEATADGVTLGPDAAAVVRGSALVAVSGPVEQALSGASGDGSAPAHAAPRAAPAPQAAPPSAYRKPPPSPSPSPNPTPRPTPTTVPPTVPVALSVSGSASGSQGTLTWSRYTGPDFAAYLVLGAWAPVQPQYPVGSGTTVVVRITSRGQLSWTSSLPPKPANVRVVAVDSAGRLLAISPVVTAPAPS